MNISISEARRRLPELVRRVRREAGLRFHILVSGAVVAELRSAEPEPEPGAAARMLLALAGKERRPAAKASRGSVSRNVKAHLYGRKGVVH